MIHDVVIVGGGPAGLSAALALGRGRKRVLLCDSGPRRNAAADHMHNFVTRDGTPPEEFRRTAREQLAAYSNVEVQNVPVASISGQRGAFEIVLPSGTVKARRVLLCTGMIDELPPLDGARELWGYGVLQCPYCHGWEIQDRPWGYLVMPPDSEVFLKFALLLRGWTRELVVFTGGAMDVPEEARATLRAAGIRLETAPVVRLVARDNRLTAVELSNGAVVPCEAMYVHPPQLQVDLVRALGVTVDDKGYVQVDAITRETSIPGVYAAGDLTTKAQSAILAAAAGTQAATMINAELTMDLVTTGVL